MSDRQVQIETRVEQANGVGVGRRLQHPFHPALLGQPAAVHDGYAVAHLRSHADVVGDEDERGAELVAQVADQAEDLGLDGDVQGRGRLVGDDEIGLTGHRHGDHHPLPQAAGQLVRECLHAARRVGDTDQVEQAQCLLPRSRGLRDLTAHPHSRIQRRHRVLEDSAQVRLADPAPLVVGGRDHVDAAHLGPAGDRGHRVTGQQPEQREPHHALTRAGLPNHREDLAGFDLQRHPTQRIDSDPSTLEGDGQVLDPGARGGRRFGRSNDVLHYGHARYLFSVLCTRR